MAIGKQTKAAINKVVTGLKKASKTHAKQAKTLAKTTVKMMRGGTAKSSPYNSVNMAKGGSTVNASGNYTQPGMRKTLFNSIKSGGKGGAPGQWSARKAQMLAKRYKAKGGGYKS
tara:strand:+ start:653 stop:997 length:345 start_codon:yes stop_codon:yes gene_type:complete